METKFTPGPWIIDEDFGSGRMAEIRVEGKLACLLHSFKLRATNEDKANAFLIAAAPDLYAALEELLYARTDKSEAMAQAALAKARGEQ